MQTGKRIVSIFLVVLMLLTAAPLAGFVGLEASAVASEFDWSAIGHADGVGSADDLSNGSIQGGIIKFGAYPQSKVTDSATISALNSRASGWQSYEYYTGSGSWADGQMQPSNYMQYCDVKYGGKKYRGVRFVACRPGSTGASPLSNLEQTNGYSTNTMYWFKYEPLQWKVLNPCLGLIMCIDLIDSQAYNNFILSSGTDLHNSTDTHNNTAYWGDAGKTYYANNYANSSLREWLNETFYATAFTISQQNRIAVNRNQNNDGYYTLTGDTNYMDYDSDPTNDKIFLLSYDEMLNSSYGFSPSRLTRDTARQARGTDYAKCQGLVVYTNGSNGNSNHIDDSLNGNSGWWLRSPGEYSGAACNVSFTGFVSHNFTVGSTSLGVRPACVISNLSSGISNPDNPTNPSSANKLVCDVTYDQDYYYTGEGLYGENAYITDTMELYVSLTNQPGVIGPYGDRENQPIHDVTMTATVNTSKLSFSPDAVKQTYSVSIDTIDIDQTVDDLLLLYPQSGFSGDETKVQVSITLSSPDFDTVQETYTSTCHIIETDPVQKHLSFIRGQNNTTNDDKQNFLNYTVSKRNEFGHALHEMASDPEYMWSRITSLDIDNYFKITFADLMASVLYANQSTLPSVLPSVISEYVEYLKNFQAHIKSILEQDSLNVSTAFLDKLLKSSKYTENGIYTDNALYQAVINKFANANNANKLKNVFAASDKTKQFMKVISWGKNVINDVLDCVNTITLLNAFHDADQEFKNVIQYLYDTIPQSDNRERGAVFEYLNFDSGNSGRMTEYLELLLDTSGKISVTTIETVLGKKVLDYLVAKTFAWLGENLLIHGVAWGSTASFTAVSTGMNSVLAGVSAGLLASEILCDSSGKAKEMAKAIHMSFYSSYILQTLAHFEEELSKNQNNKSLKEYEYAFYLHKAAQSYMVDHMAKAVEVKNTSLLYTSTNFGVLDRMYGKAHNIDQVLTQLMVIKNQFDNLNCHREEMPVSSNSVTKTKIIKVHCPVDVVIYNSSDDEVIRIEDDIVKNAVAGIYCIISDGEKYILVPDNGEYQVVITSTGNGTMSYSVIEFSNGEEQIEYGKAGIPLSVGKVFTGTIVEGDATAATDYNLKFDNNTVVMQKIQSEGPDVPHTHTYTAAVTTEPTCTTDGITTYTCTCGDTYTDPIPALGHIDEDNDGYCDREGCGEMMTGDDHCPQCGKIHNGGFFDSIVGFFHRLIYRLTHLFG